MKPGVYTKEIDLSHVYICSCCNKFFSEKEEYIIHFRKNKLEKIRSKISS